MKEPEPPVPWNASTSGAGARIRVGSCRTAVRIPSGVGTRSRVRPARQPADPEAAPSCHGRTRDAPPRRAIASATSPPRDTADHRGNTHAHGTERVLTQSERRRTRRQPRALHALPHDRGAPMSGLIAGLALAL